MNEPHKQLAHFLNRHDSDVACLRRARRTLRLAISAAWLFAVAGCLDTSRPRETRAVNGPMKSEIADELFDYSIDILSRLEQYNSPDVAQTVIGRLNEWIDTQNINVDWQADPMLVSLPTEWRDLRVLQHLDDLHFVPHDAHHLQQCVWLRDIARWARGPQVDDLARATQLFDWTVRNIQLDEPPPHGATPVLHLPMHTLFLGHGQATERAWVFMLLARQEGLNVVMLTCGKRAAEGPVQPWLTGLLSQGELYLFDPALGLPIPGPAGVAVATLGQVIADDSLLRALDLDAEHRYPVSRGDLAEVVAMVEASPGYLLKRMRAVEEQLSGDRKIVLTAQPSRLAAELESCPHVADVQLWTLPFAAIQYQMTPEGARALIEEQSRLDVRELPEPHQPIAAAVQKGRVLHLKGEFTGDGGATRYYQHSRPAATEIDSAEVSPQGANRLRWAKEDASYWLGLIAYERGSHGAAVDYFLKRTLEAFPDGRWTDGARYNLARTYEAMNRFDEAVILYENDTSPQQHGNLLRARRLKSTSSAPDVDR